MRPPSNISQHNAPHQACNKIHNVPASTNSDISESVAVAADMVLPFGVVALVVVIVSV